LRVEAEESKEGRATRARAKRRKVDEVQGVARETRADSHEFFWVMGGTGTVQARRMVDSSPAVSDGKKLRSVLQRDGYVLLRGFLKKESVENARAAVLSEVTKRRPESFVDAQKGLLVPGTKHLGLLHRQDIANAPAIRAVTECDALFDLAETFLFADRDPEDGTAFEFGAETLPTDARVAGKTDRRAMTTAYKWLRGVASEEFTGVHCDRVFLSGGSSRLVTFWIPLGEVTTRDGGLLVARGSHRDALFEGVRRTYGESSVGRDGTKSGWLTEDASAVEAIAEELSSRPGGSPSRRRSARADVAGERLTASAPASALDSRDRIDWRTCDFDSGDLVVLSLDVTHMSLSNVSGTAAPGDDSGGDGVASRLRLRVSVDTRWQPERDATDPRVRMWRRRRNGEVETFEVPERCSARREKTR